MEEKPLKGMGSLGGMVNGFNQSFQLEVAFKLRNNDRKIEDTANKIARCIVKFCDQYI
jgi:hypothetical protein